jgi:subtilisin family serine protease
MSILIDNEISTIGTASVIVVMKATAPVRGAAMRGAAAASTSVDPSELMKHFIQGGHTQGAEIAASLRTRGGKRAAAEAGPRVYPNLGVMLGTVDKKGLAGLRSDKKRVSAVLGTPQFSLIRPTTKASADLATKVTWGIEALKVPALWDKGFTGKGVLVGHLDTGADGQHATLKDAIAAFAEFDFLGRQVSPTPPARDTDDHGTHTAATIAGRPVNGRHVGVAPEAKLASAIVIEGGQVIARILGGMDWTLGQGVRILSMSLGLRGMVEDFLPITQILRARGVLPVFAVGNEGPGTSRSPGNYSEALSVGASDDQRIIADFSSSNQFSRKQDPIVPDLAAPGVDIISAMPGGGFQTMDGTSMATPHVAGLAALLMQAKPSASIDKIENAIFKSCSRPSNMPKSRGNRGIPDGLKALSKL